MILAWQHWLSYKRYNLDQSFLSLLTLLQAPNFLFLNLGSSTLSDSESVLLAIQNFIFIAHKKMTLAAYMEEDVQHAPDSP